MIRSFDARRINNLVNHPTIRPYCGGNPNAWLNLTAAVIDLKNYFLLGQHGGFCFCWSAPNTYEIHAFVLPEGRGKWAYDFIAACIGNMVRHGANHLWARVAVDAVHVRRFTMKAGFKRCGEQTLDLGAGPVDYDLYDWRL